MLFKFSATPVAPGTKRDTRLDVGLLKPHEKPMDEEGNIDPSAVGQDLFDYYLPATTSIANGIKRKFSAYADDQSDDEEPVEDDDEFKYEYVRAYETKSHKQHPDDVVEEAALIFHPGDDEKPKGAYFYPILTRYVLRPRRKFPPGMPMRREDGDEDEAEKPPEIMNVKVRGLNGEERRRRDEQKARMDNPKLAVEE